MVKLGILALFLVIVSVVGCAANDEYDETSAIIGWIAFVFLLELPGAWKLFRGGSLLEASPLTFGLPFLVLEGILLHTYIVYQGGPDVGLEAVIGVFVVPLVVLLTGFVVLIMASVARRFSDGQ